MQKILIKLFKYLNKEKIKYFLTGGIAAQWWGSLRATLDIDIVVLLEKKDLQKLFKIFKSLKFKFNEDEIETLIEIGNRFYVYDEKNSIRIDFWLPKTVLEKQAFDRRKKIKLNNIFTYIASLEDLIIFKILTGKEKDFEDVAFMVKVALSKKKLKLATLKTKLNALGLNKEFKRLKQMLNL